MAKSEGHNGAELGRSSFRELSISRPLSDGEMLLDDRWLVTKICRRF